MWLLTLQSSWQCIEAIPTSLQSWSLPGGLDGVTEKPSVVDLTSQQKSNLPQVTSRDMVHYNRSNQSKIQSRSCKADRFRP